MSDTPQVKLLQPHQLGWLRRPDMDTPVVDVWELPDGQLMAVPKHKKLLINKLTGDVKYAADR